MTNEAFGSARFLNSIVEETVEELMALVDEAVDMQLADGHPPGTEPLTLRDLKAMPVEQAAQEIAQMILDATTYERVTPEQAEALANQGEPITVDPDTGELLHAIIDRKVLDLVDRYMRSVEKREAVNA